MNQRTSQSSSAQASSAQGSTSPTESSLLAELESLRQRVSMLESERESRRRAEEALRQSQDRFTAFMDNSPAVAWIKDAAGRYLYVNRPFAVRFQRSVEDWLGKTDADRWPAETAAQFRANDLAVLAAGAPQELYEIVPLPDGSISNWLVFKFPVAGADGQQLIGGMAVDITARQSAERALSQSEERYRAFIKQSSEGIWRFELDQPLRPDWPVERQIDHVFTHGRLAECNDAMARMYGYQRASELVGARLTDLLVRTDPHNVQFLRAFVASGYKLNDAESHEIDREGRPKYFLNNMVGIVEGGRMIQCWGTQRDITERKQAEDALRHSSDLQRLMLRELDHRVRNNLASLAALIDISARSTPDVRAFADSIRGRVLAMAAAHNLLSRGHWESVGLHQLLDSLMPADLRPAMIVDCPDVAIVRRQVTAMGMILQELIANSLKHGSLSAPGGRIDVHCKLDDEPGASTIRLTLTWRESGGPAIAGTPRAGLGTSLIEGLVKTDFRGKVHFGYATEGAAHTLEMTLDRAAEQSNLTP